MFALTLKKGLPSLIDPPTDRGEMLAVPKDLAKQIRANHIAAVERGRCGKNLYRASGETKKW